MRIIFIAVIGSLMLLSSCMKDKGNPVGSEEIPDTSAHQSDSVSFVNDVRPIINKYHCASCHPTNGGFNVSTYQTILAGGTHGNTVIPGNGEGSNLIKKLRGTASFGDRMPRSGPPFLTDTEIQTISTWIDQGAKNN